jgi:hypothetical protein
VLVLLGAGDLASLNTLQGCGVVCFWYCWTAGPAPVCVAVSARMRHIMQAGHFAGVRQCCRYSKVATIAASVVLMQGRKGSQTSLVAPG